MLELLTSEYHASFTNNGQLTSSLVSEWRLPPFLVVLFLSLHFLQYPSSSDVSWDPAKLFAWQTGHQKRRFIPVHEFMRIILIQLSLTPTNLHMKAGNYCKRATKHGQRGGGGGGGEEEEGEEEEGEEEEEDKKKKKKKKKKEEKKTETLRMATNVTKKKKRNKYIQNCHVERKKTCGANTDLQAISKASSPRQQESTHQNRAYTKVARYFHWWYLIPAPIHHSFIYWMLFSSTHSCFLSSVDW